MAASKDYHVIYVPGLGDSRAYGQDDAVTKWEKHGLTSHYFPLGWADKEPFQPKLERLLAKIDELLANGHLVSLVGVSAGASAVLNAYAQRPSVHGVVLIGGKVNNPQTIGERIYKINPAFRESVFLVKGSLAKLNPTKTKRILSIHPLFDGTVPVVDTLITGAVEKSVPVIGHRLGIFFTIVFRAKLLANFLKSLPSF